VVAGYADGVELIEQQPQRSGDLRVAEVSSATMIVLVV